MHISEYLSMEELKQAIEDKLVNARFSVDGQVIYNYSNAAMYTPGAWDIDAVCKCRGLIVDSYGNIVARSWQKFYNYGQAEAGELRMDAPVEVTDKADGSLAVLHYDQMDQPRVATRGSFESEQAHHATKLLWTKYPELKWDWRYITPLAEVIYPENRIVCVQGNTPLTLWDGTHIRMDEIVYHDKRPVLRGMDPEGNIVPTEILATHDNGYGRDWVVIRTDSSVGSANTKTHITVTPDHRVHTPLGWVEAKDLEVGDEITSSFQKLNSDALHVIESSLLGDGCLHGERTFFSEGHTTKNSYGADAHKLLGNLANKLTGPENFDAFHTSPFDELGDLRNKWYDGRVKVVPKDLTWMDDFTFAKWYMDDGCLTGDGLNLATHCFTYEETERLGIWIYEQYRVSARLQKTPSGPLLAVNKGRNGGWNDLAHLWQRVAPYMFKSMTYKVPKEFHSLVGTAQFPEPAWHLAPTTVKVTSVEFPERKRTGKKQYDLTTTTGNYFARNLLVHNCDYGDTDDLVLLGGVNVETGDYYGPNETASIIGWTGPVTEIFEYKTLHEALMAPPRAGKEGMCVRYLDQPHIVKIKQEDYLMAHAFLTNCTPKMIWERIGKGSSLEDLLSEAPDEFLPLVTELYLEIEGNMQRIESRCEEQFQDILTSVGPRPDRKTFAEAVKGKQDTAAMFMLLDGKDLRPYSWKIAKPEKDGPYGV